MVILTEPQVTTVAVLLRAAELVEEGWTQAYAVLQEDDHVSFCLTGAIAWAARELAGEPSMLYMSDVYTRLGAILGTSNQSKLQRWNDTAGRTQEEVVAVLRKAAE